MSEFAEHLQRWGPAFLREEAAGQQQQTVPGKNNPQEHVPRNDSRRENSPQKDSPRETVSRSEAESYTRQLARSHYENFPVVTWLLPRRLHQHFYNVYAFCRWADDLGDEVSDGNRSLQLLGWWRNELQRCFAGAADHPVFIALRETVREFSLPLKPFDDLISAFEQDQRVCEYETFAQLRDYCRRSADPVGRIVLHLCRSFNEENASLSDCICTGLQLTNFWQDVARDFEMGRVYLPAEDRERFGYRREDLQQRRTNGAFVRLMEFEVQRAREFLQAGLPLSAHLPGRLRIDIELFARGGLKVLDRIAAIGYGVWEHRPVLRKRHVFSLLIQALVRSLWRRRSAPSKPGR